MIAEVGLGPALDLADIAEPFNHAMCRRLTASLLAGPPEQHQRAPSFPMIIFGFLHIHQPVLVSLPAIDGCPLPDRAKDREDPWRGGGGGGEDCAGLKRADCHEDCLKQRQDSRMHPCRHAVVGFVAAEIDPIH
ncbi:hypothetical protein PDE_06584 [Penicillium oxalicum 114-2]|uniref:Uncharacterized protein n=1 Tax=Penicillium oxalicum (strain 114-2 / CGMCC 5302) TaxID=933388 RepID=S7ZMP9_PENO1|nr:hypothetical protein PDE_06584 [Penicillium oxalicum 114-2]